MMLNSNELLWVGQSADSNKTTTRKCSTDVRSVYRFKCACVCLFLEAFKLQLAAAATVVTAKLLLLNKTHKQKSSFKNKTRETREEQTHLICISFKARFANMQHIGATIILCYLKAFVFKCKDSVGTRKFQTIDLLMHLIYGCRERDDDDM